MSPPSPTTSTEQDGGGIPSRHRAVSPNAELDTADNRSIPKPKRLACMICRKRKLKCDGIKPSCSTCTRLGHSCAYDEVRRKSGPKRGYVKALEERLKQVETLLNKTKDSATGAEINAAAPLNLDTASATRVQLPAAAAAAGGGFSGQNATLTLPGDRDMDRWQFAGESPQPGPPLDDFNFNTSMNPGLNPNMPIGMGNLNNTNFPWEMIGLGLEEPLPPQETIDELHQIYFEKVHPSMPMIHKYRYLAAMNLIGLHRLDGAGLDVKQCLPPPRDWTEREERRRTFWMAFCEDRYASIGTGWPMTIDEKDIMTNLPSSDEAFDMSRPEQTQSLQDSMSPAGASKLSSFGGIVLMACLFGRNLIHLHRPDVDDRDNDLNGEFWKRHRAMDNIILNTSLCLPPHIKLPSGLSNPNIVFTNMSIHTSTICLHQAAIFKADKNKLPASVSAESKVRCITAANEIASIMRMISHMDLSCMNPFIAFCLYVAARVFVQYLKSRPDDSQTADSLRFLLSAMNALKRRNPLTESFLVQLDVDLEALGMRIPKLRAAFPRSGDSPDATAAGKRCDEEGASGILAYRNDCNYTNGDDAVPVTAPGIVEPISGTQPVSRTISDSSGFSGQRWLGPDAGFAQEGGASRVPLQGMVLTPGSGSLGGSRNGTGAGFGQSESSGDNTMGSPDGDQSNRPTPNSSSASEHRSGPTASVGMEGSSRNSFDASPASNNPSANIGVNGESTTAGFFADSRGFNLGPTGMTPGARFQMGDSPVDAYGMASNGWPGMPVATNQGKPFTQHRDKRFLCKTQRANLLILRPCHRPSALNLTLVSRQAGFLLPYQAMYRHRAYNTYFPHVDNVYSHRSSQKYKRKPFVSHYYDCRLKGRPPGTPKSDDPNKKKRKRAVRELNQCDVKIKITEYFPGATLHDLDDGTYTPVNMPQSALSSGSDRRFRVLPAEANDVPTDVGRDGQKFYTIQRVNGHLSGSGIAGPHRHTLARSDEVKKNSVLRFLAKQEQAAKKIQTSRKASEAAAATIRKHSKDCDTKFFAACYCFGGEEVAVPLEDAEPANPLFPPDARLKANCRVWIDHINTMIVPSFFKVLRNVDETLRPICIEQLQRHITELVLAADEQGPFFLGDALSIVDVHFAPIALRLSRMLQPAHGWTEPLPNLRWELWLNAIENNLHVQATTSSRDLYLSTMDLLAQDPSV
ncbi:hypothetical protein ACHAP6_007270 [Verticillium nonalfalfae]